MEISNQIKTALIGVLMLLAVNLINAQALSGSITSQTNASCFGMCDGSLTASGSGGTGGPYTYSWAPGGQTTQTINALCAGNYTCTVDDGVTTFTVGATVTEPAQINASASNTGPYCVGQTIQLNATGGNTYSWAGPNGFFSSVQNPTISGATTAMSGTYTVTVTVGTCTASTTTNVIVNPNPTATASNTGPYCAGQTIQLNATGGTAYTWFGPGGFVSNAQNPAIASATTAMSGIYTVTVTIGSCTAFATTTVVVNANPSLTLSATDVTCNGMCDGTASATVSGGTAPYQYIWNTNPNQTTQTATALCAATYTCTVMDANGCAVTNSIFVNQPAQLTASVSSVTDVTCNGLCDGSATAVASGGTQPYSYLWNPGVVPAVVLPGACAGTYTCDVTDANGCTASTTVTINQPAAVNASITNFTNVTCNGACDGTATANATGGITPYAFQWSQGATGAAINGLCAGTYTCYVSDANTCTVTATVTITEPPAVTVSAGSNQTICFGTNVALCATASGGVGAFTYSWAPATGLSSTTTACPIGNPTVTTTYTVTVIDANGCIGSSTVTVFVTGPVVPVLTSHVEPSCSGTNGAITFNGTGGSGPYFYDLTPPSIQNGTGIFNTLSGGTYSLTATDMNGCSGSINFQLLDSCEVVWPGDADNDLVANNNDILDIGLYYGSTGPARFNANTSWTGQPSMFWTNTKANGFNEKHDDCNGDGVIDASDTTAVIQNYNLVHPPYKLMSVNMTGTPLVVDIIQDTVSNSGTANIKVSFGTATSPASNVYGIALTLSIDTTIVAQDSTTMDVSNSWIAAGSTPFLNNVIENYPNGEIDIVLCRTNHTNISGYGEVADLSVTMKDDISGKIMSGVTKTLHVNISKVKIISANGDTVSYSASGDSLVVDQVTTFVSNEKTSSMVKLFPNPANEFAMIHSTGKDLVKYEVYSLQGKKIDEMKNEALTSEITINTKSFEKGIYLVKAYTLYNVKVFRLQVN